MLNKYEEAIQVLKQQVYIIPPLSIPGLSYFKDGEIIDTAKDSLPIKDEFEIEIRKEGDEDQQQNSQTITRRSSNLERLGSQNS
jgi:hypothetical protein